MCIRDRNSYDEDETEYEVSAQNDRGKPDGDAHRRHQQAVLKQRRPPVPCHPVAKSQLGLQIASRGKHSRRAPARVPPHRSPATAAPRNTVPSTPTATLGSSTNAARPRYG